MTSIISNKPSARVTEKSDSLYNSIGADLSCEERLTFIRENIKLLLGDKEVSILEREHD